MPDSRRAEDILGSVDLPENAEYGIETARALENFKISGHTIHPSIIRAYLRIKMAASCANAGAGAISGEQAKLICEAGFKLLKESDQWETRFPLDPYQAGAGTNLNMNVNEVIAHLASREGTKVDSHDHVNRSQSTNDTFPTAIRLALLEESNPLLQHLNALIRAIEDKAKLWGHLVKAARTHLQDAVPITLGQEFSGYGAVLLRCYGLIEKARDGLRELGIGASAAGTGINVPAGYIDTILPELEKLTGEKLTRAPNLFEALQSQLPIAHYLSCVRLTALELTRICNDLRLLSSGPLTGLGEITLPAVQLGSSIMPGKINPSILEMANQVCYSVIGLEQTTALALQAGQLDLNVMTPIMGYASCEATRILSRTLETLRIRCINGLEVNENRLKDYFEKTPQIATALTPILGYQKTSELVRESMKSGKSVLTLVREKHLLGSVDLERLLKTATLFAA